MKQIAVISGKGGTGKTVVSAALASLVQNKVMVDCDVDAADLHLLLHPRIKERHEFKGSRVAGIDSRLCRKCGKCLSACRFSAISPDFVVEDFSCEGCGLCSRLCPYGAIRMKDNVAGEWFVSETKYGPFVHARLGVAEENSGKLVARIRQAARELAEQAGADYVIIDGPPGIGCPVIASLSGADCALIVTEPTISGLHDAERVMGVIGHFGISAKLLVNKYDLNKDMARKIEEFSEEHGIAVIGRIAFDASVAKSLVARKPLTEYAGCAAADEIHKIWEGLK